MREGGAPPAHNEHGSGSFLRPAFRRSNHRWQSSTLFRRCWEHLAQEGDVRIAERLEQRHRLHDLAVDLGQRIPGSFSKPVRLHGRFRDRGTEYVGEHGMERMRGGAKR